MKFIIIIQIKIFLTKINQCLLPLIKAITCIKTQIIILNDQFILDILNKKTISLLLFFLLNFVLYLRKFKKCIKPITGFNN